MELHAGIRDPWGRRGFMCSGIPAGDHLEAVRQENLRSALRASATFSDCSWHVRTRLRGCRHSICRSSCLRRRGWSSSTATGCRNCSFSQQTPAFSVIPKHLLPSEGGVQVFSAADRSCRFVLIRREAAVPRIRPPTSHLHTPILCSQHSHPTPTFPAPAASRVKDKRFPHSDSRNSLFSELFQNQNTFSHFFSVSHGIY